LHRDFFAHHKFDRNPRNSATTLENLASIKIKNVTITSSKSITPPWEAPSTPGPFGTPAGLKAEIPFCRVEGFSAPTSDSHIGFEATIPTLIPFSS
jgi:hypothetical protein